jgi:hypothetical protein
MLGWKRLYWVTVVTLLLLVLTGTIPEWGVWYSVVDWYRPQMNALIEGQINFGTTLSALEHDNTWSGGGVQQVR